jgi:serine/threonine protein kinase
MSEAKPLQPEQSFAHGRFVLIQRLGRGGMGEVWLARDERLQEQVALKFLPPEIRGDAAALDDLRRETARSHKLSHPNIVRLHDLHEDPDGTAFIVMEYIDGPTLATLRLQQPGRVLAWDYMRPLIAQLCAALEYAHGERVIHRDLKPANMMVDSRGRLKLADFGIAAVGSDSLSRVSVQHSTSGTPPYMSPQQVTGKRPQVTDDLYALGATLYELLTSQPPFHGGDLTHQVLHEPPEPMEDRLAALEIQNSAPADVAALVMACLAKEPEQRPQSAGAVAEWIGLELVAKPSTERLSAALFPHENPAPEGTPDEPERKGLSTPARLGRLWAAVGFVVLVMAGAIWLRHGDHRPSGLSTNKQEPQPVTVTGAETVPVTPPPAKIPPKPASNSGKVTPASDDGLPPLKLQRPTLGAMPSGHVVVWGTGNGQHYLSLVPAAMGQVVAVAGGGAHSLALTADGRVWAWGAGTVRTRTNDDFGQSIVPPRLNKVVAIAAGADHSLALRQDGTVVGWGRGNGQNADLPADLTNVVAIAAGANHNVALTGEGLVRVWGANGLGQANVPEGLNHVVAIASGPFHVLALRSDGTVVAWGENKNGQSKVPVGLSNVIAIAGGRFHSAALKADGKVVVWGGPPAVRAVPPLSGVVAIAAGENHTLALRADGTVIAWGLNNQGQCEVPSSLSHVAAIAAGSGHSLALTTGKAEMAGASGAQVLKPVTSTLLVPGTSDPWLAGMPDGSTAAWQSPDDVAPAQSPALVAHIPIALGAVLTFSATGQEANGPLTAHSKFGPEGNEARIVNHSAGAQNGLADLTAPIDALIGVFLDDSVPSSFAPPAPLVFGPAPTREFLTLQPALRQPFFIGRGLTSRGVAQQFIAPRGATRLFLGTMDSHDWTDNVGGFTVTVTRLPALMDLSHPAASPTLPSGKPRGTQ